MFVFDVYMNCVLMFRRGYAAASQGAVSGVVKGGVPRSNVMMKKSGEESVKTSWVPDPVTGYYRPEGQANEIDAAELRKMLLKHRSGNN